MFEEYEFKFNEMMTTNTTDLQYLVSALSETPSIACDIEIALRGICAKNNVDLATLMDKAQYKEYVHVHKDQDYTCCNDLIKKNNVHALYNHGQMEFNNNRDKSMDLMLKASEKGMTNPYIAIHYYLTHEHDLEMKYFNLAIKDNRSPGLLKFYGKYVTKILAQNSWKECDICKDRDCKYLLPIFLGSTDKEDKRVLCKIYRNSKSLNPSDIKGAIDFFLSEDHVASAFGFMVMVDKHKAAEYLRKRLNKFILLRSTFDDLLAIDREFEVGVAKEINDARDDYDKQIELARESAGSGDIWRLMGGYNNNIAITSGTGNIILGNSSRIYTIPNP